MDSKIIKKISNLISSKINSARLMFDWLIRKRRIARVSRWTWFQIKMLLLKTLKNGWFIKKVFETQLQLLIKSAKSLKPWMSFEISIRIELLSKDEFKITNLSRLTKVSTDRVLSWCWANSKVILTQSKRFMNNQRLLNYF